MPSLHRSDIRDAVCTIQIQAPTNLRAFPQPSAKLSLRHIEKNVYEECEAEDTALCHLEQGIDGNDVVHVGYYQNLLQWPTFWSSRLRLLQQLLSLLVT